MALSQEFIDAIRQIREQKLNFGSVALHAFPQFRNHALFLLRLPEVFGTDFEGYQGTSPILILTGLTDRVTGIPGKAMQIATDVRPYSPRMPYPTPRVDITGNEPTLTVSFREHTPKYYRGENIPFGIANMTIRQIFDRWISLVAPYDDRRFAPGGPSPIDAYGTAIVVWFTPELNVTYAYHFNVFFPTQISPEQNQITPGRTLNEPLSWSVTFAYFYPEVLYDVNVTGEAPPYDELVSQNLERLLNQ